MAAYGLILKATGFFCFGNSSDLTKGVILSDLSANYQHILDTDQLFKGHTKFSRVYQARNQT